jgi:hypothetical protein
LFCQTKIDREVVKNYVNRGFKDSEIAKLLECSKISIGEIRRDELGIKRTRKIIDRDILKQEVEAGLSDNEIADKYDWKRVTVQQVRVNNLRMLREPPSDRQASFKFFEMLKNSEPIFSKNLSSREQGRINVYYHSLRMKGLPIRKLIFAGYVHNRPRHLRWQGRFDFTVYFVEGQEQMVWNKIMDNRKMSASKIGAMARMLGIGRVEMREKREARFEANQKKKQEEKMDCEKNEMPKI